MGTPSNEKKITNRKIPPLRTIHFVICNFKVLKDYLFASM